ncbi:helix-turn-helix domain-containing protein [Actinoplanes sp. NPDC049596]|uniref:helix-turn-helix domain-containing protein n=1 Tax=unclassified Actinoplanes TaxID=2626549 RepID=UPI0034391D79
MRFEHRDAEGGPSVVDRVWRTSSDTAGRVVIGGQDWEAPTYENAEQFVRGLRDAGLVVPSRLDGGDRPTQRTLQRRFRAVTGLSRTAVTQIDRANAAATMLRAGRDWPAVVDALGYFDQAHLGHALRRYVGRTARELQSGGEAAMSFSYKISPGPGS